MLPANVMIMGAEVWRTLRSFKKFRELYNLSRGSESSAELACKNLGEVVSFKGYLGDITLSSIPANTLTATAPKNISLSLICWSWATPTIKGWWLMVRLWIRKRSEQARRKTCFTRKTGLRTAIRRLSTCRRTAHRSRFRQIFANLLPSKLVNGGFYGHSIH